MKTSLATITGVMLTPGVSKNNRLYTESAISKGVKRMRERLADPDGLPIIMRTHHDAGDDSRKIVGQITDVWQEADGSAGYKAKLFNTEAGRDLAPLIKPDEDGKAALRTTSIHGFWVGPTERFKQQNGPVETGEDLEINAIDFTYSPGVTGAQIKSVTFESTEVKWPVPGANVHDGYNIFESMEASISIDEVEDYDDPFAEDYNTAQRKSMAAKGQAMQGGRYPVASKSDLRKAIRAVGRGKGSHDAIRQHIIKRAKALGLSNMIPSNWTGAKEDFTGYKVNGGPVQEFLDEHKKGADILGLEECYIEVCIGNENGEMLKICADNLSPDIVKKAIKRAGGLAKNILANNDDGSMDSSDDDMVDDPDEIDFKVIMASAGDSDVYPTGMDSTGNGGNNSTGESAEADENIKESAMSETTAATAAPVGESIDYDKIGAAVAKAVAESLAAIDKANKEAKSAKKAAKSAENATAETKKAGAPEVLKESITAEQLEAKLVEEREKTIAELRESLLKEGGLPGRKGFRTSVNESDTEKALTADELWEKRGEVWAQAVPSIFGTPAA